MNILVDTIILNDEGEAKQDANRFDEINWKKDIFVMKKLISMHHIIEAYPFEPNPEWTYVKCVNDNNHLLKLNFSDYLRLTPHISPKVIIPTFNN